MSPKAQHPLLARSAFSLIEVLVATAVLGLVMVILVSITDHVRKTYQFTRGKADQFKEARAAFETMARRISQATLNTYWDYDLPASPNYYVRQSELRFRTGQASMLLPPNTKTVTHAIFFQTQSGLVKDNKLAGLENLLNTCGYFIEFGDDSNIRPSILPGSFPKRYRFRLMELIEPSDELSLYKHTFDKREYKDFGWFRDPLTKNPRPARVLAENVVALIVWPKDPENNSLTSDYAYDSAPNNTPDQPWSEHQLPPLIHLTMVVIDEDSARRLADRYGDQMPDILKTWWFTQSNQSKYDEDMGWLRRQLTGEWEAKERVSFRIFTTTISLRGAKWNRL